MNNRLSFSIALNLMAQNFHRGANAVKQGLKNIQYQVLGMAAALGAGGLGLSNLVSRFVEVARETNRARVALQNVSDGVAGFGKNMSYLKDLAKKYGQDLNTVTFNFARFSAASQAAGVNLQDQYKIYSSVTKAVTAFGLSGEEANLTYMALGQMMSKGKVSSEELRRQMGERIPIAMQAMARAAGVTIQELDKMLKNGEVYSAQVLPKFAEQIENMLGDINTDNIETSVNRLKTAFISLTENLKVGELYKSIIDTVAKALGWIEQNTTRVIQKIVSIISTILIVRGIKSATKWWQSMGYEAERAFIQGSKGAERAALKAEFAANKSALTFKYAWTSAVRAVKVALSSLLITGLVFAITEFVTKLIEARRESERIKGIFREYQKELASVNGGREASILKSTLDILNSKKSTQEEINNAQSQLNSMLGTEIKNQDELNKKVAERISLLEATARANYYADKKIQTQDQIDAIYAKYGGQQKMDSKDRLRNSFQAFGHKYLGIDYDIDRDKQTLEQLYRILNDSTVQVESAIKSGVNLSGVTVHKNDTYTPDGDSKDKSKEIDLQKAEREYKEKLSAINNAYAAKIINEKELGEEMRKLGEATSRTIAELLGVDAKHNDTFSAAQNAVKLYPEDVKEKEKWEMPSEEARDTTFDYKKTAAEKLKEAYEFKKAYVEKLKKLSEDGIKEVQDILTQEENKLSSMSGLVKIAEIKEDLNKVNKEIQETTFDSVKDFANTIDRLADSFTRLGKVMNDPDASAWEKILNVFNTLAQAVDTGKSLFETWKGLTDLLEKKKKTQDSLIAVTAAAAAAETGALATVTAAKVTADTTEIASASAKSAAIVAGLTTEEIAAKGVMAAKSAAAYAGIPFAGVALAAGQVATMQALISASKVVSTIPGFTEGGILGGNSFTGDKLVGRFNSGEMILNRSQQMNLFKAINSGKLFSDKSSHSFMEHKVRIEGRDLVAVFRQENIRKSRV